MRLDCETITNFRTNTSPCTPFTTNSEFRGRAPASEGGSPRRQAHLEARCFGSIKHQEKNAESAHASFRPKNTTQTTTGRERDTHVVPPRGSGLLEWAEPHARLLHLTKRALDRGDARCVRARADLAKEALEVVLLQLRGRVLDALGAGGGRARAVRVGILLHFCLRVHF